MKKKSSSNKSILSRAKPVHMLAMIVTALIYGRAGTGKTTIAGTFPKPLLLLDISEKGTDSIADEKGVDVLRIEDWDDFEAVYWELEAGETKYKTVVVDALHAAQALAILKSKKGGDAAAQTTKHDFMKASQLLQTWVVNYRDLEEKGINVVFICHDRLSAGDDGGDGEEGVLAPEVGPRLMPSIASLVTGAVKVVGHTFIKETLTKKGLGKKPERKVDYCLRIGPHGFYTTKIRSPKSAETPDFLKNPTYENLVAVMKGNTPATANTGGPKKKVLKKKSHS